MLALSCLNVSYAEEVVMAAPEIGTTSHASSTMLDAQSKFTAFYAQLVKKLKNLKSENYYKGKIL